MRGFTSPKVEWLYRFLKPKRVDIDSGKRKRILICNQGGLGDVYLSTFMIPALRSAFAECEIGVLTIPAAKSAAVDVEHLHIHPYWFLSGGNRILLYFRFLKFLFFQKREMAKDLSKKNYDLAIVANPYFSGMAHVLYQAKIPCRIGFATIGDRKFLTKVIPWKSGLYLLEKYKILIEEMGGKAGNVCCPWGFKEEKKIGVVFHMFSADQKKDLPLSFWKALHDRFLSAGYTVYFTGKGEDQRREIAKITSEAYNLCNQQDWKGYMKVICSASFVISVDTVAVHLAAAAEKPYFAIYRHTPHFDLWYPPSGRGKAFHWPVDPEILFQEVESENCR